MYILIKIIECEVQTGKKNYKLHSLLRWALSRVSLSVSNGGRLFGGAIAAHTG